MTTATAFTGFDRNAMSFWHELAMEMNRDWYLANKARYQNLWVEPTTALLTAVRTKLATVYHPLTLHEPKILRLHRDVRFAKDKTPYKTHIGGVIALGTNKIGEGGYVALYFHIGLDQDLVGTGAYTFGPSELVRWRKAVAGKAGVELVAIINKLRKAGFVVGGRDDYKKVPKGFAPDHPRADLLKQRGLTAMFPDMPRGLLHDAKLTGWLVKHGKTAAPLVLWLHRNVG